MKKAIYLSGPISGLDYDDARQRFEDAEIDYGVFTHEDVKVYNPMSDPINFKWKTTFDKGMCSAEMMWEECMKNSIGWLVRCDEIVMLKGWKRSKGAKIEHRLAKDLGMKIIYQ